MTATMKIISITAALFILFSFSALAAENTNAVSEAETQASKGDPQDTPEAPPSTEEEAIKPPIPAIPPSITPEQIKQFLSKQKSDNFVVLNFDNAELSDVINTISSITGENFIVSSGLNARITIHSSKKIPVSEVLNVFESILEVNGISLVKSGDYYKIVSSSLTKQKPLEIYKGDKLDVPYRDRPLTQIIPVEYVPVREISTVLTPLLSQAGSIIPNPRNNLLIINDNASSVRRLLRVLKELDVDAFQNKRMGFFQPKYSDVKSLSDELISILNALNLGREGVVIVPIERINSLVVFASSRGLMKAVEGWIKKLDEEVMTGQNIFVYHVQNVKADSIANVLNSVYTAKDKKIAVRQSPRSPAPATSKKKGTPASRVSPSASPGTSDMSGVEITIFEPTNSLVILAPPGIYREIISIVKKLDVYPREVLIEVIIAEVSLTDDDRFGVQWSVLNDFSVEGDPNYNALTQALSPDAPTFNLPLTLDASLAAGGFSYLLYNPDKLLALIHALASRGKVDILSSPRLLVKDQEEASIEVGSDIPTAVSSSQTAEITSTLTQTIQYKTVGIKLKIKPSINDEKTVVLDIEQEVSDQLPNVTVGQQGFSYPAFSTRKTKTSIIVPDKQGIVIGGIMKEKKDTNYQGVPLLSSIPVLGRLFRYTVEQKTKTELIILLRPHVVATGLEADLLTREFIDKLSDVKQIVSDYEGSFYESTPAKADPTEVNGQ
jgi:general secretion pathway protein D